MLPPGPRAMLVKIIVSFRDIRHYGGKNISGRIPGRKLPAAKNETDDLKVKHV